MWYSDLGHSEKGYLWICETLTRELQADRWEWPDPLCNQTASICFPSSTQMLSYKKKKTGLRLRLEDLLEYFRFVNLPGRYKNPFIFSFIFFFPPFKRFRQITQPLPLSSMSPVPFSHVHLNQGFRNSSRTFLAQFGLDSNKKLFSGKPPPLISGSVPK